MGQKVLKSVWSSAFRRQGSNVTHWVVGESRRLKAELQTFFCEVKRTKIHDQGYNVEISFEGARLRH
jgi:hypothetical protein